MRRTTQESAPCRVDVRVPPSSSYSSPSRVVACGRGPSEPGAKGRGASDALAAVFAHPPDAARPWAYWMWMDGNLSREGITADLESMRAAGLGGVVICEVNVGVPRGPVEFMSPEWRGLFKHVVREAERLGLEVTLNAGPGWTGSGGPWVKPEESMQHIVAASVDVSGPARFDAELPRPARRPAFFGEGGLPQEIKATMDGFYRDVAVLAFPTPAAGRPIADIDEKALYVTGALFLPAGRPAVPAVPGRIPRPSRRRGDRSRAHHRHHGQAYGRRPPGLGRPGRPLDHPPLRPDDDGCQHAPRPGPRPRPRVRQARRGRL